MAPKSKSRICANIKSKRHSTVRCSASAINGEFCARHAKNPTRWNSSKPSFSPSARITRSQLNAVRTIQKFWKLYGPRRAIWRQGPTLYALKESSNTQDIYTCDPVHTIPRLYRFSYLDQRGCAWTFDIRFLLQLLQYSTVLKNPFTQQPLPPITLTRIDCMVDWLKQRSFSYIYATEESLTAEQHWNQKVLNICLKYHSLGYAIQPAWFEGMTIYNHVDFYTKIWNLWNYHLGLSEAEKSELIPGHGRQRPPPGPLFRWNPSALESFSMKPLKWWRKSSLSILERFVSSAKEKSHQTTAALYCVIALANSTPVIRESYPFLLQAI
jgi:hypothetical protein